MSPDSRSDRVARRIIEVVALAGMGYALAAVLVRVTAPWSELLTAIKPWFRMSLHNGLLIFLLGLGLFALVCCAHRRVARVFVRTVAVLGAVVGLVALLRPWLALPLEFERWIAGLAPHAGGPHVGPMSPHTGGIVLCLGLGLGFLLGAAPMALFRRYGAFALAAVALGGCAVALLGFALGVPLERDSPFSRLHWSSALGYALLAVGLMLAAFPHNWLLESLLPHDEAELDRAALRRFQRALALALIGLAVGLGIVSFHFLRKEKANLRARAEQELTAIAELKAEQIADWRADRLKEAKLVFHTPYAARRALDVLRDLDSERTRSMYVGWLKPLLALGPYSQALLLDAQFTVQFAYPENGDRELSRREHRAVQSAFENRSVIMTDLERAGDPPQVILSLAVPIIVRREGDRDNVPAAGLPPSPNDRAAAALILRVDARRGLFDLVSAWPTKSATGEALLIRHEAGEALVLNAPRQAGAGPMELRVPLSRLDSPLVAAALGQEGAVSGSDYRDAPVLAVARRVPGSNWSLLVKMDAREVYAPIRERGLGLGLLLSALLVTTGLGLNLLWKRRDIELLRHQVRTEHERLTLAQRLTHLMRHANDIILLTDAQWRILDANERALETYGYTLEELRAIRAPDLRVPSERPAFAELEALFQQTGELRSETIHQRKDGSVFPVEASARRVRVDDSEQIFIILRDISERKRAEAALRESEERFRLLAEASLAGIYLFQTDRFLYVNPALAAIFGYRPEEIIGRLGPLDLTHPDDRPRVVGNIRRRVVEGLPSIRYEFRGLRKDGSVVQVEALGARIEYQGRPAILGTLLDVTERRRAEEQIRRQAALLDAANEAIYVRRLDDTVTYWNAGAARLYGWTPEEMVGRKFPEGSQTDREAFEAARAALLKNGYWSGELSKTTRTGKRITVFCRWTLLRDAQGRPSEVLVINSDITEKKQLETQFLRAQRMESIGALAGGIAHDLNNLLAPIFMSTSLLRETVTDPQSRNILSTIASCAHRAADIIRQLLTFARGQPGARVPVPVRHLFKEMEKLVRETFPRNIQMRIEVPADLWPVLGDATQIHQALLNLCLNARDAMPEGGTLTLRAANITLDERARELSPDAKPGSYVYLSVSDTGVGIPPEHLERIFEPFFTTKEPGKGTGLGLATVLGIARGHGGFVRVHSRPGEGTTFEIYLPASTETAAAPAHSAGDTDFQPPRGRGELVLVVDDEAGVRSLTQRALEVHGYRVLTASDGLEALALFRQRNGEVTAVLTDMMMPGMDGPTLIRSMRELAPDLPVIGMTGLAQRLAPREQEELGLAAMLIKPFSVAHLFQALEEARMRRRSQAATV